MIRPPSIVRFEQCYLGAVLLGLVNTALSWTSYQLMPQVRQASAMVGSWYLPATIVVSVVVNLILWYFVARRGSVVAKWFVVVFFGFAVLGILSNVLLHSFVSSTGAVLGIAALVLNAIAVWMLFKPDARAWFGEADDRYYEDDAAA